MFAEFLEKGHQYGVPIIPMYDTGTNAPELIAELAAMNGVDRILMGSSRRGALHHIIKGSFQRRIESRGLIFKIRVIGSNLQQKGTEKL